MESDSSDIECLVAQAADSNITIYVAGCFFCGQKHAPSTCPKVPQMSFKERWHRVRVRSNQSKTPICFRCYGDHSTDVCREQLCDVPAPSGRCNRRHHRQLCWHAQHSQ
jgi:hypothetical protein